MFPIYSYKSTILFGGVLCMSHSGIAAGETEMAEQARLRLHVVFKRAL